MAFGCQAIYVFLVISQSSLESHLPPLFRSPTANAIENILVPVIKVKKKKTRPPLGLFIFSSLESMIFWSTAWNVGFLGLFPGSVLP
jgi:hypothetical protein